MERQNIIIPNLVLAGYRSFGKEPQYLDQLAIGFQFLNSFKKCLDTNTQTFDAVSDFLIFAFMKVQNFSIGFKSGE